MKNFYGMSGGSATVIIVCMFGLVGCSALIAAPAAAAIGEAISGFFIFAVGMLGWWAWKSISEPLKTLRESPEPEIEQVVTNVSNVYVANFHLPDGTVRMLSGNSQKELEQKILKELGPQAMKELTK